MFVPLTANNISIETICEGIGHHREMTHRHHAVRVHFYDSALVVVLERNCDPKKNCDPDVLPVGSLLRSLLPRRLRFRLSHATTA